MEVLIAVWLISGVVAAVIWTNKGGNGLEGFFMGAVLGIFGIIMAAVMTPQAVKMKQAMEVAMHRECPFCKQQIRRDASVCAYCQRESEPWTLKDGMWWTRGEGGMYYLDPKTNAWVLSNGAAKVSTSGF